MDRIDIIIETIKFRIERVSSKSSQKNILSLLYITLFSIWTIVLINTNKILIFLVIESIKNNLTPKSVTT